MPSSGPDSLLARRTLELVDIPSESRNEAAVAAYVEAAVPLELAFSDGTSTSWSVLSARSGLGMQSA